MLPYIDVTSMRKAWFPGDGINAEAKADEDLIYIGYQAILSWDGHNDQIDGRN